MMLDKMENASQNLVDKLNIYDKMLVKITLCVIGADRKVLVHRLAGIYPAFLFGELIFMKDKILSVFIDESGDFGEFNPASPYYYVAIVFHDQSVDITSRIKQLDVQIDNWGYPNHAIHTGPLIRRESLYENDTRENRRSLFNALYHFTRLIDIKYICPTINQAECLEKTKLGYTDRLTKEIVKQLREVSDFLEKFDRLIVYYDGGQIELTQILTSVFNAMFTSVEFRKTSPVEYKLSQSADLICTVEAINNKAILTKSETEFFGSKRDFKKNIYKNISNKRLL